MLAIKNISKTYGASIILEDVSITLGRGTILSILGKSGGGKTTLLKIIAGLLAQDSGTIAMNGIGLDEIPAYRRHIMYLYQEPLLFPHLNVFNNLAFGLKLKKEDKHTITEKVHQIAGELEIAEHLKKMPGQLSGGQKQRVSFGRSLILKPDVLLLDEPFGNLDTQTRATMQALFKRVAVEHQITAIFVTHDLKESLLMGNEYAMLQSGRLTLYDSREKFINDPSSGIRSEISFWKKVDLTDNQ
jgi:ABC-type sugar transport system ATPase subunit